ncbi:hypothetical protein PISMIDRAFT_9868 [Pisolithus microcarpus 441]|uniref:Uncharacterized protein n=1 Tax=Pisolithus microcarpus 441 TaxID=765257 RepID=A0A0C9ZZA0_9AGAM|nr:hypothetical protein PISMIDRAFT_9868 [Pisolithus microcarpus 441]
MMYALLANDELSWCAAQFIVLAFNLKHLLAPILGTPTQVVTKLMGRATCHFSRGKYPTRVDSQVQAARESLFHGDLMRDSAVPSKLLSF